MFTGARLITLDSTLPERARATAKAVLMVTYMVKEDSMSGIYE
jgi:hypothetical protein